MPPLRHAFAVIAASLFTVAAFAQVRPGQGGAGGAGGGGAAGGPGGGGGGTTIGVLPILPGGGAGGGGGGAATTGLRVVADTAILAGDTGQANLAGLVAANAGAGGAGAAAGGGAAAAATYQWTMSGGRITSDPTRPTVTFIADTAGTATLNVVVTSNGTSLSASAQVTVISPALAGEITAATPTVATNAASVTATVPAAQDGDRTFRWTVAGTGAAILTGQGTDTLTFRPGSPGLLQVLCDVTLQRLVTVPLRSFVLVTGNGAPVVVTVNGGSGSGTYPSGSRVDVFANPPPAGQVFDKWTGDIAALGAGAIAPSIAHGVITVPTASVTLAATYKAAPAWTPTVVATFNPVTQAGPNNTTITVSTTLAYTIPAAAQGLVFLLHDTGDSFVTWFNRAEQLTLARDLVAAGYGVAALNSVNRNTGAWNTQTTVANNPDAANFIAALARFARDGTLAATKPVFFLGFANGADAAARFADLLDKATPALPIEGTVLYCATGGDTLAVTSRVPQFFALAANDDIIGTAGNTSARDHEQLLAGRGIATAILTNAVSPVYSGRFRALGVTSPTFTPADADVIWRAINAAGLLDTNSYLKSLPTTATLTAAVPAAYQGRIAEIAQQLTVAFAAQEFYSDADARVINFLNGRVADAPVPAPGRLINLATRSKIAVLGDTFALGFNISGPQKATLHIRGIGPALVKFGLPTALPAPRLEVNQGSTVIASNEGWDKPGNGAAQIAAAAASVGAFALTPGDLDAAVLLSLDPGTYTVTLKGINGSTGEVLAEVYDVSKNATRLTNLSTLAKITSDGEVLIPGIVIEGNNPRTLVIRAVGPGLTDFGIPDSVVLGDPRITILSGSQTVATNNNWAQGGGTGSVLTLNAAFPVVGAFPLKATNSDAALVDALAPGAYTLQAGASPLAPGGTQLVTPNQTGTVLVEVYEVP